MQWFKPVYVGLSCGRAHYRRSRREGDSRRLPIPHQLHQACCPTPLQQRLVSTGRRPVHPPAYFGLEEDTIWRIASESIPALVDQLDEVVEAELR
jgi:hypothetical protein